MRIWAFPSFYPYDSPGEKWKGIFAHRQYKSLVGLGADLKVIVPVLGYPPFPFSLLHPDWKRSAQLAYPYQRQHEGITVYHPRIANAKPNRFVKKTYSERYIDTIVKFFKNNKIKLDPRQDIFYSQWLPDSALVQQAAHQLGIKSAILGIGDDIVVYPKHKPGYIDTFRRTLVEADLRMTNADYLGREANDAIGMDLHFETIYFEVDFDTFTPPSVEEAARLKKEYKIPQDKVAILIVGSSIIRKGWLDLFEALKSVKKVTSNFVLAGVHAGVPEFDFTHELASRGLTEHFIDLGEVKPDALHRVYKAADIFCLPSHWEGLATVVIESMACGLPVVTTNICGHPEMIKDGISGFLVPPKQPDILAERLLGLLSDTEKRKQIGKSAREHIVSKLNSRNTKTLYKLLQETLSK